MNYDFACLRVLQFASLTNCETHKLHNISHFSILARLVRLAMIFSREASLIFHKILRRKIAKQYSLSTLTVWNTLSYVIHCQYMWSVFVWDWVLGGGSWGAWLRGLMTIVICCRPKIPFMISPLF
jgi:hypothetical protein